MNELLTLDWIITTLKKSGCNSKQIVIDRLEKAHYGELKELINSLVEEITNDRRLPF